MIGKFNAATVLASLEPLLEIGIAGDMRGQHLTSITQSSDNHQVIY